jgi:hypothetical protein
MSATDGVDSSAHRRVSATDLRALKDLETGDATYADSHRRRSGALPIDDVTAALNEQIKHLQSAGAPLDLVPEAKK